MSTTVDERVVEMRFDNKHFESNVSTSMSTLDKLKQKLNLSGASKGLEDIDKASKKVNMTPLGSAVDAVQVKFSALQVMATTALANITNSAVNAGKRMVSALTLDPVTTGFKEYETQINAVQTILANTSAKGTTITDVTAALDELNKYADMTIYNFTEMTRNIGTFTAAGVDLETSVGAIQGIANLAAVSGSTSQQASTAMYQLSQALASGTVKLMDWNSVVNAGMGGEVFQNALKETSRLLGTGADEAIKASGSFRESLRDGWLTAEVLTETLKKFTTSGANEYVAKYIGESPEVVEAALENAKAQYGEAEAIEKASEALAKKSGKNKDEIKSVLEMAQTATDAATKVKTFSQLWDVMKEAAQSGWAKTWQIIIGDFEEAKALLTPLSDFFTNVINKMSDARNKLLESALGRGFTGLVERLNGVLSPAKAAADVVNNVGKSLEDLNEIVNQVIRGDWDNGHDRNVKLTEAGYNYYRVQNMVNEALNNGFRYSQEKIEEQDKLLGATNELNKSTEENVKTTEEAGKANVEYTETTKERLKQLMRCSDEDLRFMGYTEDQIEALRNLAREAEKLGIPLDDFIDNLDQINGRWLVINSFKNIGKALIDVINAIKDAWHGIFPAKPLEERAENLYDLIAAFHKFTTELKPSEDTIDNLTRTFKGLFAVVDIIATIFGGAFRIVFKVVKTVLEALDLNILDVTASIGDALVSFRNWLFETNPLAKAIDNLISKLPDLIKKIKEWFAVFKQTPAVQKFIDAIKGIGDAFRKLFSGEVNVGEFAASLGENLGKLLKSLPGIAIQIGKDFLGGFTKGIGGGIKGVINNIVDFCLNFVSSFAEALGVHSPSWKAEEIAGDFFQGFINGAKKVIGKVIEVLKTLGEGIVSVFAGLWDYLTDESGKVDWNKILIGGLLIAVTLLIKKFLTYVDTLMGVADDFKELISASVDAMKNFAGVIGAMKWEIRANALKSLAIAIGILVASVWVLTTIEDTGKLWNAVLVIGALAVILIGLAAAMNMLSSVSVSWSGGPKVEGIKSGLLQIGLAILLVAWAVKMMAGLDEGQAKQGFKAIAVISAGMVVFLIAIGAISRYSGDIQHVGGMMMKLSIAMILMVWVCKLAANLTPEQMIKGALFAGAFIGFVAAIAGVTRGPVSKNINKVGGLILKVTFAMLLMVGVCKLAGKLSIEEMTKGALFAGAFVVFVGALVAVTKVGKEQKLASVNGLIFSVSVSMLMLVGICKLAGMLSKDEMIKGAAFMGGFIILLGAMVRVLTIGDKQKIAKVTTTIMAMAVGLAVMAGICILLGTMELSSLAKGVTAVSILSVMMALMVSALKGAQNVAKSMMWVAVSLALMAAAVVVLSNIDPNKLGPAVLAMASLMGMFALMVTSMKALKKDVPIGPLIAIMGSMLIMAGILVLLDALNVENSIRNAAALSILMGTMAGLLVLLNFKSVDPRKALDSAVALTTLVIPLLVFAIALNACKGVDTSTKTVVQLIALMSAMTGLLHLLDLKNFNIMKVLENAAALATLAIPLIVFCEVLKEAQYVNASTKTVIQLTALMGAMTGLLYLLTPLAKLGIWDAVKGAIALTAMALPMFVFITILKKMNGAENAMENVKALTTLMGALTLMLLPLTLVGALITPALLGLLALTLMAVPMLAFIGVLALMKKVENATENINLLLNMMTVMTKLLTQLALIGPMAIVGVTAMTMLATLMSVMGVVATAIGALMTKFPSIEKFLDTGLPVLERLGGSIGTMIGNFISGIAGGFGNAFVKIGNDLVLFTTSLSIASVNASRIKAGSFDGVKDLMTVLLEIAGTSVGTSIADMFTSLFSDQTSMEKFIEDATALFEGMAEISKTCSAADIDTEALEAVTKAAQALADLQNSLEPIGGFMSWLTGKDDLATFGENAADFFDSMKVAMATLEGMTVDTVALKAVIDASTSLSDLQKTLEPIGGVVDWFTGRDDLATFGENISEFFISMKTALATLEGTTVDTVALEAVIKASERLSEFQQSLESIGGVVDWFTGRDDLATFGENVAEFFESMKIGLATLEGTTVDETALESVIKASERLSTLQGSLNNIGGVLSWFKGRDDLGTFGESVKPFAIGMQELSKCGVINTAAVDSMVTAGGSLNAFQANLPAIGGIADFFTGRTDLGDFGTGIASFATGMQSLSLCGTINIDTLTNLIAAGDQLSEFQESLPNIGGVIEFFAGRSDLGTFGTSIGSFATGMQALSGCTEVDTTVLGSIITAAGELSTLQKQLEPQGGILDFFVGRDDLGTFASTVATFMTNMKEAFSVMDGITVNGEAFTAIEDATGRLSTLQKTLDGTGGIVEWWSGRDDLGTFAETVKTFMIDMKSAFVAIEGVTVDSAAFDRIIINAGRLNTLQDVLDGTGGIIEWWSGRDDLGTFGETVKTFMLSMKSAFSAMEGMTVDSAAFDSVILAAGRLNALQSNLESIGGVVSWFTGRSDLGTFGEAVGKFADGMKALAECTGFDETTITSITTAAESLNTLQGKLDTGVGGVVSWFAGRTDLGTFGSSIGLFATGMQALADCRSFKPEVISSLIDAAERLATLETGLTQNVGGVVSWFTGRTDLGTFGTNIGLFATGMQALANCTSFKTEVIDSLIDAAERLATLETGLTQNVGGIVSWWTGRTDLGTFGTNIGLFATGMQALADCTALKPETITTLIDAAGQIAEFTTHLSENFGGLFTWFKDKTEDMQTFSTNVSLFATGMKEFGTASASVDPSCTENFISAAKKMKDFIGGLADFDATGFDTFKSCISSFATRMIEFSTAAITIDPAATTNILSAATRLKAFISSLADFDGTGFDAFKSYITSFAIKMGQFSLASIAIDPAATTNILSAATRLRAFINSLADFNGSGFDVFKNYITTFAIKMAEFSAKSVSIDFGAVKNATNAGITLKNFINGLASINTGGVESFKAAVNTLSTVNIAGMLKAFSDASGKFSAAGATIISKLINGIESRIPGVKAAATKIISVITAEIESKHSMLTLAGANLANKLNEGISNKEKNIKSTVSTLVSSAADGIRGKYNSFYLAGAHLVDGFSSGISQNAYKAAAKAKAMAEAAVEAAREELDINSPSKVFKAIGSGIPEGFAMGIGMLGSSVKDSVTGMASTAIKSARSAMTTVLEALNGEMDAQPTIRPVIDLTDVRSGANAINGMFSGAHTVGVQSNLNAINFAMNRKLQNGINDDVVSAIKDLNNSLDNARGDTYNLGGVTYSNGDEVADAVQTIVRAALIGRRV